MSCPSSTQSYGLTLVVIAFVLVMVWGKQGRAQGEEQGEGVGAAPPAMGLKGKLLCIVSAILEGPISWLAIVLSVPRRLLNKCCLCVGKPQWHIGAIHQEEEGEEEEDAEKQKEMVQRQAVVQRIAINYLVSVSFEPAFKENNTVNRAHSHCFVIVFEWMLGNSVVPG